MKKTQLYTLTFLAGALMYACGPTPKEIEAKRTGDSIRVADSLANVRQAEKEFDETKKVNIQNTIDEEVAYGKNILKARILSYDTADHRVLLKTTKGVQSFVVNDGVLRKSSSLSGDIGEKVYVLTNHIIAGRVDSADIGRVISADYVVPR